MNDHPCETCLRWPECNGVDVDTCPLFENQKERTEANVYNRRIEKPATEGGR